MIVKDHNMDSSGAYSFLVGQCFWASSMNRIKKYVLTFKIYDTFKCKIKLQKNK